MIAKSLDVVVILKLLVSDLPKTYAQLSTELGISASEIHAALKRGIAAGLIDPGTRKPLRNPLEEYLIHGVRYSFPASPGPLARGVPTAYAAPPLVSQLHLDDLPPVWADPEGRTRGFAVEPLYPSVTHAVKLDSKLYELLALVDAMRIGRARERQIAEKEIKKRLANVAVN